MGHVKMQLIVFICLGMLVACGNSGSTDPDPPISQPTPAPSVPEDDFNLVTQVPLNAMNFENPESESCYKYTSGVKIPYIKNFTADGNDQEWLSVTKFSDPEQDSAAQLDMASWQYAMDHRSHFNGVVRFKGEAKSAAVVLTFQGIAISKGKQITNTTRQFLLGVGTVRVLRGGKWKPLAPEQANYAVQGTVLEWSIAPDALGEAVYWPLWSVSLQTRPAHKEPLEQTTAQERQEMRQDFTAPWFYENILELDEKTFEIKTCSSASSQKNGLVIQEIQESTFTKDQQAAANQAFGIARAALGNLYRYQEYFDLPIGTLSFIATDHITLEELRDQQEHTNQLILPIARLTPDAEDYFYEGLLYQHIVRFLIHQQIRPIFQSAPIFIRRTLVDSLTQHQLIKILGVNYWLFQTSLEARQLFSDKDRLNPVDSGPLMDWESDAAHMTPAAKAKISALSRLWQLTLSYEELWDIWLRAEALYTSGATEGWQAVHLALEEFFERTAVEKNPARLIAKHMTMEKSLPKWNVKQAAQIWDGWVAGPTYHLQTDIGLFRDKDRDGLPEFLETMFTSSDETWDSDGDGWTDYAEVALMSSPTSTQQYPPYLVADGFLGDWLELLPRKLHTVAANDSSLNQCGKQFDIRHFGAYFDQHHLMVAAHSNPKLNENQFDDFSWEVVIQEDKGQKRQFALTKHENRDEMILRDLSTKKIRRRYVLPYSAAMSTLEVVINASDIFDGLKLANSKQQMPEVSLQVRLLRQIAGKKLYCTHTEWFKAIKYNKAK